MIITPQKIILSILSLSLILVAGCNHTQDNTNQKMPNDFNFSLTYGTYGKQKVDTFTNVVVKDLVEDGTIEANISLTQKEKQAIYNEMMKINIMGELKLDKEKECETEPASFSQWNVKSNEETKSFSYTTYCEYPEDVLNLIKLEEYIHEVVSSKKEYIALPEAKGHYE
ncbi:hypothetical protein [Evansella tamaricis]|uniref:Lipoprotein n=1 Tax=Evansella tamaricis TaxID=2069301 RepID=A0ABS6JKC4_9BACI|nr:hypothetical protein [Evansella tamaricis]MBU9713835.1 hypothetical protein [Evansella tamaricis]